MRKGEKHIKQGGPGAENVPEAAAGRKNSHGWKAAPDGDEKEGTGKKKDLWTSGRVKVV